MNLEKRKCPIKMRLVPYGGGWTEVYVDFGDGDLYFIVSCALGDGFETLMRVLYHLFPENNDPENADELVDYKYGVCEMTDGDYIVKEIVDSIDDREFPLVCQDVPWKASFTWDEEGSCSNWTIERIPDLNKCFMIKISIDLCRNETIHYEYSVKYEDMCYAVANACTIALKTHGFWGYHHACYSPDMNVRYLLFLKSIALNNMEARELTFYDEKGKGETADFNKEIELLLFDMDED